MTLLKKSFNNKRWKSEYNPNLIFASTSISVMCEKKVLDPIPHSQHRPICINANPVVIAQPTVFRRRFNLKKANWKSYAAEADARIEKIKATPEYYGKFIECVRVASRRHIPRGCRRNYIPGSQRNQRIYTKHTRNNIQGSHLMRKP